MTALGVLCCFALFVCLTLLASFFLLSSLIKTHNPRHGFVGLLHVLMNFISELCLLEGENSHVYIMLYLVQKPWLRFWILPVVLCALVALLLGMFTHRYKLYFLSHKC